MYIYMIALDWSKSTWEPINYERFFSQFRLHIIISIQQLQISKQKMFILFNQIYLNKEMLVKYTHTHTHTHLYIYIYIYINGAVQI